MSKHPSTHLLTRPLDAAPWLNRPLRIDAERVPQIASACRRWFPELTSWSDEPLATAFVHFSSQCLGSQVTAPAYRDCCFLIYLYDLHYVQPDAFARYRDDAVQAEACAFKEIEATWLGSAFREPSPVRSAASDN